MAGAWQQRIDRASQLARQEPAAAALLLTYRHLLELQRTCDVTLQHRTDRLTGSLDRDLPHLLDAARPVLVAVTSMHSSRLAQEAVQLLERGNGAVEATLREGWETPSDHQFFARTVLQPYAALLAALGRAPSGRADTEGRRHCPFCGGAPQVSVLLDGTAAAGAGRHLICGTCFTAWPLGRVLCPHCGEQDEHRLCYFGSPEFAHLRIDACDTCGRYLKSVDLARAGAAVPIVDEVAGAALDVWAAGRGYRKILLNLIGL